jgi:O-antigen ligase
MHSLIGFFENRIKNVFLLYIFFAPFTTYFAVSARLRFSVIINLMLLLGGGVYFLFKKKPKLKVAFEDLLLLFLVSWVFIVMLIKYNNSRSVSHAIAFIYSILGYYLIPKIILFNLNILPEKLIKTVVYSFVTVSIIIIVDFLGKNFLGFELRTLIVGHHLQNDAANMSYYIRSGLYISGGTAEEPGSMGLMLNVFFPIALSYFWHNRKMTIFLTTLYLLDLIMIMSAATMANAVIAFLFLFLLYLKKRPKILIVSFLITVFFSVFFLLQKDSKLGKVITHNIQKVTFSDDSNLSSNARMYQWGRAIKDFIESPILGKGPGFGKSNDGEGYLSVHLTILVSYGIVGFLCYIIFFIISFVKAYSLNDKYRFFFMFSFITFFVHWGILSDFYHAPVWILLILIQYLFKKNKNANKYKFVQGKTN